jgi:hypothetical protein
VAERRGGDAFVVGFRHEDPRRFVRHRVAISPRPRLIRTPSGMLVPSSGVVARNEHDLDCEIMAGKCIGCGHDVYLNALGMSALYERDADVCCMQCEADYDSAKPTVYGKR